MARKQHYLLIWDKRVVVTVNGRPRMPVIEMDGTIPSSAAFHAVKDVVRRSGKVHTLFILCHGIAGSNRNAQVSGDFGGMGLQFGSNDVLHGNVVNWTAIKNKAANIVVYACAAADTEPGNEGTTSDGKYLMGALAIHTEAHVFAADRIQRVGVGSGTTSFDPGAWEGRLWWFPPSGESPKTVTSVPVDIGDVYNGSAP